MATPMLKSLAGHLPAADGSGLPGWYRERQQRARERVLAADWPQRGNESFKYTSLHALGQRTPVPAPAPQAAAGVDEAVLPGARFVDGHCVGIHAGHSLDGVELDSLAAALARDDERLRFVMAGETDDERLFPSLNAAFASDGAWLRVAAGTRVEPWLTLDCRGRSHGHDTAWHLDHRIDLGEGAQLCLIIDISAADSTSFATMASRIRVQAGGHLHLVWLNAASDQASVFANTCIDLESRARLTMQVVDAGAAPSRHDLAIALRGENALAELGGAFLLDRRRHADMQLDMQHLAGNADSDTRWRVIADDRSRAVFNGYITVAPGADGTDAQLNCKSLLGSPLAEVDAQPALEIHAEDVKCGHGATVGQLDDQALFYLRSRGIDADHARVMLERAFAVEAFAAVPDTPAATRLVAVLDREPA